MSFDSQKESQPENGPDVEYTEGFSIRGMLGQGGIGRVFLGVDKRIGREVAIKEPIEERLGENRARIIARFVREARICGQLEHFGIVPVYELNKKPDGSYFYVMRRMDGKRLKESIEECNAATPEEELRMRLALLPAFISVCEAMGYAHSRGVIHRDLKPENIMFGEFGEVVILDWGLAKRVNEEESEKSDVSSESTSELIEVMADLEQTRQGAILGTPSFMSPEQINSRFGAVGTDSDVYGLGALLFLILTGEKPYKGEPKEIMQKIVSDASSPSPSFFTSHLPAELVVICEKAMAKKREDRFENASILAEELKAYRDGRLVSVYAYSRKELFSRFVTRNKIAVIAASIVMLSIIGGSVAALKFAASARIEKTKAERALEDVTSLSGSAMELASDAAESSNNYFKGITNDLENAAREFSTGNALHEKSTIANLKALQWMHSEAFGVATINSQGKAVDTYPPGLEIDKIISGLLKGDLAALFKDHKSILTDLFVVPDGRHAFAIISPILKGSKFEGAIATILISEKIVSLALSFDPAKSNYQVWCMRDDGLIFYDEDSNQIGRSLFADAIYMKFPELQKLGEKIRTEPEGLGYYSFAEPGRDLVVYKIAAWKKFDIADNQHLKVVVAYPYMSR